MGVITKFIAKRSTLADPSPWMLNMFSRKSKSGIEVNEMKAMQATAVFGCVRILSETLAMLPLPVYKRLEPKGKERARGHYLYDLLQNKPNDEMTSFTFRETMMAHLCLWGNAYAEIERDGASRPVALWPLMPNQTWPERHPTTKRIIYKTILPDGQQVTLDNTQVLHIPGLSLNGLKGMSPIAMAKEAVGLSLATEEFGANFFENGTNIGGIAEHPGKLTEQGSKNLRQSINETYAGLGNSHRLMLLEEGMKFEKIGIPPNEAQFLETRKFQKNEIASIFRVPPHMLADLERATFSNIEHQGIEFVTHSIGPWLKRWEQVVNSKLFGRDGRKQYFAEFLVDALLRGDIKTRYEAYAIGRQNGWLNADDIREKENENPLPDGQGQIYLIPLNMIPANSVSDPPIEGRSLEKRTKRRQLQGIEIRRRTSRSYKRMFKETYQKIINREEADVMRQAKKQLRNVESFNNWLSDFYREHEEYFEKNMLPVLMSFGELMYGQASSEVGGDDTFTEEAKQFVRDYLVPMMRRHNGMSIKKIRNAIERGGEDIVQALQDEFDSWDDRAESEANEEVTRSGSAIAKVAWVAAGITVIRWVSDGENCPYCDELDGKIVGIHSSFVRQGEDFQPEGAESSLSPSSNISHPPIHNGCDCSIAPE